MTEINQNSEIPILRSRISSSIVSAIIAEVVNKVSPLAILYLAKHKLGTSSFGHAQGSLTFMEAALAFVVFGYGGIGSIEIGEKNSAKSTSLIAGDVLFLKFIHFLLMSVFFIVFGTFNTHFVLDSSFYISIILVLASTFDTDFLHYGTQTMAARNYLTVAAKILALVGVIIFVNSPKDSSKYVFFVTIPPLIITVFSAIYHHKVFLSYKPSIERLIALFKRALPFGLGGVLFTLLDRLDVLLVNFNFNSNQLGVYTAQMRLVQAVSTTAISIGIIFYSELLSEKSVTRYTKLIEKSLWSMLAIVLPVAIGAWFIKHDLVAMVFGEDIAIHSDIFFLLMLGGLCMVPIQVFGIQILLIRKKLLTYNSIMLISFVISIVWLFYFSNLELIDYAYFNVITKIFCVVFFLFFSRFYLENFNLTPILKLAIPSLVLGLFLYLFKELNLYLKICIGGFLYAGFLFPFLPVNALFLTRKTLK